VSYSRAAFLGGQWRLTPAGIVELERIESEAKRATGLGHE